MLVLLLETIYLPRLGLTMQDLHFMSSLFLGLTVCSIPFVVAAEREALKNLRSAVFLLLGAGVVVGLTLLRAHAGGLGSINYSQLQSLQYAYLLTSGAVDITAMDCPASPARLFC